MCRKAVDRRRAKSQADRAVRSKRAICVSQPRLERTRDGDQKPWGNRRRREDELAGHQALLFCEWLQTEGVTFLCPIFW
jgi:hypothetical protein